MIVLASTSKYRAELLSRLSLDFICAPPHCDETPIIGELPHDLATRLAKNKALSLVPNNQNSYVIGSDQVAAFEQDMMGKPGSIEQACEQLQRMSGQAVVFYTALCIVNTQTGVCHEAVDETTVQFRVLSDDEIRRYVQVEQPLDCAGSFKVEGLGISLFDSVTSSDPTALIGLPLISVCEGLRRFGVL